MSHNGSLRTPMYIHSTGLWTSIVQGPRGGCPHAQDFIRTISEQMHIRVLSTHNEPAFTGPRTPFALNYQFVRHDIASRSCVCMWWGVCDFRDDKWWRHQSCDFDVSCGCLRKCATRNGVNGVALSRQSTQRCGDVEHASRVSCNNIKRISERFLWMDKNLWLMCVRKVRHTLRYQQKSMKSEVRRLGQRWNII